MKIKVQDQIIFLLVRNADLFTGAFSDHHYKLEIKSVYYSKASAFNVRVL